MNKKLLSGGALLLAAGLFVAINIISNSTLTNWRLDLTQHKLYTLSQGTDNILKKLNEPIKLRFYFSNRELTGYPALLSYGQRVRDLLEEYVARSNGKVKLTFIDPEPFSQAEDQAVSSGLRQIPLSNTGDVGYFGLVGTNSTDDQQTIAFFNPDNEDALEYNITKLIYNLAHPKKQVVGVISTLPVFGQAPNPETGQGSGQPWTFIKMMREQFDVRNLGTQVAAIPSAVHTLMVIHPKKLSKLTRYAIDQFVLHGGKAMVFVDPLSEADSQQPDPMHPNVMPDVYSNLPKLFKRWGLKMNDDKIAGDIDAAIRVSYQGSHGEQQIEYIPWLHLGPKNFDQKDFITNQLKSINLGSAGILKPIKGATTKFTPLIFTGPNSMAYERDAIIFQRNPAGLLDIFKPDHKDLTIAARIHGMAKTAFPYGRPKKTADEPADPDFIRESKKPINVIVVADTDILSNRFWVRTRNYMGVPVPYPVADNGAFVINALDNLGGNDDLISLRSRGRSTRPFVRVQALRRQAEDKFRDQEQALQQKLKQTEAKLQNLQTQQGSNTILLTPEQRKEIEQFRHDQVKTREQLRKVQRDLRKNIERLGTELKFINIGLIPLLIGLFAAGFGIFRALRRPSH